MKRFFITIEYDGTNLVGWQRQNNGPSVQAYIEQAALALTGHETLVQGSGRTDAGVHATGQVAHLDVPDKFDERAMVMGLNAKLKTDQVRIVSARQVEETMHARFSAVRRAYLYRILNRPAQGALMRQFTWHIPKVLTIEAMQEGANQLIGKHDFTSFRATACQAKSPIRTLDRLFVHKQDDEVHIIAEAPSFLHHQIRNITGTLAQVGLGKWQPEEVKHALDACDRAAAGPTAPPQGLYLTKIDF